MQFSAPIYRLKRAAKLLSRQEQIPLHEALDRVAAQEGFGSWSLLAAKGSQSSLAEKLFADLTPGDMVLVGARPGQGKTLLSLELAVEAMKCGQQGRFFTLEYTEEDVNKCFSILGVERARFNGLFEMDSSDDIDADYIVEKLVTTPRGTFVIVDYLQLLDQKREKPKLTAQVLTLAEFARANGTVIVILSQIHRLYNPLTKPFPDLEDVKLPNAVDLKLFNKTCFLNNGKVQLSSQV